MTCNAPPRVRERLTFTSQTAPASSTSPGRRKAPNAATTPAGASAGILGMHSNSTVKRLVPHRLVPPTLELRGRGDEAPRSKRSTTPTVMVSWPHHLSSEDDPVAHHEGHHHHHHHQEEHHHLHVPHTHNHHLDVYDQESGSFETAYSGTQKSHAVLDLPSNSYIRARMRYENELGEMSEGPEAVIFGRPHVVRAYGCGR